MPTPDALFSLANTAALLGWLVLALTPLQRPRASRWATGAAVTLALALATLYTALVAVHFSGAPGGFGSLDAVAALFSRREMLLAGWVHYLAFDLLVGAWVRTQAQRARVPPWALAPCLLLIFLLGPLGWLVSMGLLRFRQLTLPAAATSPAMP